MLDSFHGHIIDKIKKLHFKEINTDPAVFIIIPEGMASVAGVNKPFKGNLWHLYNN